MDQSRSPVSLAGPGIMLISAAIFGYFGFTSSFIYHSASTGQLLIYVPLLDWTLKATAIAFLVSGLLTFKLPLLGNTIYATVGLLSAVMFLVVAMLDFADKQHTVMSPLLLLVFAAWNGYGSWLSLREIIAARRTPHDQIDQSLKPES